MPMHASDDSATPLHPVMRRLIAPWEYRHLRAAASVRFAGGGFNLGIGVVLLGLGHRSANEQDRRKCYRWGTWFLVHAALLFLGGYLDMTADRTAPPRT
jgi:hypothetical protein